MEEHLLGVTAMTRRGAAVCAAAIGLVSLGFYAATMAPGLTWAHDGVDGGALAAAARTLGIPHPPGYPTYVLLAHLFTWLPVGEVATRTNLFSAFCAAGTAALLTWTLAIATRSVGAAAGAGLALAFSPLLWFQAVITEVQALNALFAALLLALTTHAASATARPSRLALMVGGVWGLSLGNHLTISFCVPLVILALGRLRRSGLWGIAGIVLGLIVYLYLPLRAAAAPPINWGDPRTPARFWWMVSGGPYDQFVFSLPRKHLLERLLAWAGLLTRQFGWVGMAVVALGAAMLSSTDGPLFVATSATAVLCSAFAIGYNTTDSYLYLLPALVCLGLWLGWGVAWLIEALAARVGWMALGGTALAILLPLATGILRIPTVDLSGDRLSREFEAACLEQAPAQAVIMSSGDASTFGLWYFQYGLGHREDVVVVDTELLGYDWYVAQVSQRFHELSAPQGPGEGRSLDSRLLEALRSGDTEALRYAASSLGHPVCRMASQPLGLSCVEP